jgi:hypothetical protein
MSQRSIRLLAGVLAALLVGCTPTRSERDGRPSPAGPSTVTRAPGASARFPTPAELRAAVTVEAIRSDLAALQAVADRHGGNRAAGTPGYDASVDHVVGQLRAAGYRPRVQRFQAGRFRERGRPVLEPAGVAPEAGRDYRTFEFSGSGDVTAPLHRVDLRLPRAPTARPAAASRPTSPASRGARSPRSSVAPAPSAPRSTMPSGPGRPPR